MASVVHRIIGTLSAFVALYLSIFFTILFILCWMRGLEEHKPFDYTHITDQTGHGHEKLPRYMNCLDKNLIHSEKRLSRMYLTLAVYLLWITLIIDSCVLIYIKNSDFQTISNCAKYFLTFLFLNFGLLTLALIWLEFHYSPWFNRFIHEEELSNSFTYSTIFNTILILIYGVFKGSQALCEGCGRERGDNLYYYPPQDDVDSPSRHEKLRGQRTIAAILFTLLFFTISLVTLFFLVILPLMKLH